MTNALFDTDESEASTGVNAYSRTYSRISLYHISE